MNNSVSVKVKRTDVQRGGLDDTSPKVRAGVRSGLDAIGLLLLNSSKRKIQRGSKTGRIYRKYNPKRTHQASAPGESPATDTGGLVSSGFHEIETGGLIVNIGFAKLYAAMLEFGTRRMRPRPFMKPALDENRSRLSKILGKFIREELK